VSFVPFCSFLNLGWGLMYICMLHFHSCIISCVHICIIDYICIICFRDVLLLYTLITMICWMWAYDFAIEAIVMYSYALSSFGMYMHVQAYFLWKCYIWSSLVSWMPFMLKLCRYGYILHSCLICACVSCSFHLGSKIHLSSWMFSLPVTLWRNLSFFLPQRHFMYDA
jgi:hypothetical protein